MSTCPYPLNLLRIPDPINFEMSRWTVEAEDYTNLATTSQLSALGLSFRWRLRRGQSGLDREMKENETHYNEGYTHETEQSATFLVMFLGHFDSPASKPFYIFRRPCRDIRLRGPGLREIRDTHRLPLPPLPPLWLPRDAQNALTAEEQDAQHEHYSTVAP